MICYIDGSYLDPNYIQQHSLQKKAASNCEGKVMKSWGRGAETYVHFYP